MVKERETIRVRRDQVIEGDILKSSHGYDLLIAIVREGQTVSLEGWLWGRVDPIGPPFTDGKWDAAKSAQIKDWRGERYPASSVVTVERDLVELVV